MASEVDSYNGSTATQAMATTTHSKQQGLVHVEALQI